MLAAVLLTGCGAAAEEGAPSGQAPGTVSLADVAGADATVLDAATTGDGRAVVLLAPPGGPLTLADVAADDSTTAVPVPGLDAERQGLARIAATGDVVVVVGIAAGRVTLVPATTQGAGAPQPVGTLGAADVTALDVTATADVLYLALSAVDGTHRLFAVDPATGAVRDEATLPGTPRDLAPTDGGLAVATDAGRSATVVVLDAALDVVAEVDAGPGTAGPLTAVDGGVVTTAGRTDEVTVTRDGEVLATVPGDLPALITLDPAGEVATLVDTVADGEVPRVLQRSVDLAAGEVTDEVGLCDNGAVAGADVDAAGRGVAAGDCGGEPVLWRIS